MIANRLVELFPFHQRYDLYKMLVDILCNCASVPESYNDPRFTLIKNELGLKKVEGFKYQWFIDENDDNDNQIEQNLDAAIYRFINQLSGTLSDYLVIKYDLQYAIKDYENLDRNDAFYEEKMDKIHSYINQLVEGLNDSIVSVKFNLFYEKEIPSFDMDLYLLSIVEKSRKVASSNTVGELN
ncbi:hypothetical protein [Ornithinibacillus sp. 179-J 7C1 HS]|uniref:hypothetical protein n=1 Tax=Ornithinibacillus sp. 179-J 7C1 HS TaxID=3142384 RepID=UPI00399F3137